MSGFLERETQGQADFEPGNPGAGYYNDLTGVATSYGTPEQALGWFEMFALRRERTMPVALLQLGLGAWQRVAQGDGSWLHLVRMIADWAAVDMDARGRYAHYMPMPHTYEIQPPWYSSMAQGQAASLLVRAAGTLDREDLHEHARRSIQPLVDPAFGLVTQTDEGPVLQEYPSNPPAHVLNGWIWSLWGLHDVACVDGTGSPAHAAFGEGVDALVARLPLYDTARGWSRYDLYPHPVVNVASPFYHRLAIEQLRAMHRLAPREELLQVAERWEAGLARRSTRMTAVARKVGFRMLKPRKAA